MLRGDGLGNTLPRDKALFAVSAGRISLGLHLPAAAGKDVVARGTAIVRVLGLHRCAADVARQSLRGVDRDAARGIVGDCGVRGFGAFDRRPLVHEAPEYSAAPTRPRRLRLLVGPPKDAGATKLLSPAFGMPVSPSVRIAIRDDHQMPEPGPDRVVAAGAPVGLIARNLADLGARHGRPRRRLGARPLSRCRRELDGSASVPPGHRYTCSRMNPAAIAASEAPVARASSLRDRSNEWPASSNGT
jgi:hypothetical protein